MEVANKIFRDQVRVMKGIAERDWRLNVFSMSLTGPGATEDEEKEEKKLSKGFSLFLSARF